MNTRKFASRTAAVFATAFVSVADSSFKGEETVLKPDAWYFVSFATESAMNTTGKTITLQLPGALYVKDADLARGGETRFASVFRPWEFAVTKKCTPSLGTWLVKGPLAFTDFRMAELKPRYVKRDGFTLGEGEAFMAERYRYASEYGSLAAYADRPFRSAARGTFHQPFWRLAKDGEVVYRHTLGGHVFKGAEVTVSTCYGDNLWAIEVSADGTQWIPVTETNKAMTLKTTLPAALFPCKALDVRVIGRGAVDFRVASYEFRADVEGALLHAVGRTDWIDVETGKRVEVPNEPKPVEVKGFLLPGDDPGGLRLWTCDSGWKVMPESAAPSKTAAGLSLRAAANETEAVQLVLRPDRSGPAPKVSVGKLVARDGANIPSAAAEILRVGYVPVDYPSDKYSPRGLRWPDPLFDDIGKDPPLVAGENRAYWIRVKVPKGTPKGIYRGQLTVECSKSKGVQPSTFNVQLDVEVFGFELPDTMTCQTEFGLRYYQIIGMQRLRGGSLKGVLEKYVKCLADHHITPGDFDPSVKLECEWTNPSDPAKAEPKFNWDEYDRKIERGLTEYAFNTISVPTMRTLGCGTYQARKGGEICGVKDGEPGYEELLGKFWRAIDRHFVEKGWTDKAYVYWFDEPDEKDYLFVSNGFARLKKYAPHLRRMITEQPENALMDGVNLWCPVTPSFHQNPELLKAARDRGDGFWWYVCCAPKGPYATEFIDKPGVEMRVWLWQTWKENVSGVLIWDTVYWTSWSVYDGRRGIKQNPYLDTQSWADNGAYGWGNGDGRFLYPPVACYDADGRWISKGPEVMEGPVESYRLEMLRDGLEDYEYFAILKRLNPANPLLTVPEAVTSSMKEFSADPEPMASHRSRLAREIERRMKEER